MNEKTIIAPDSEKKNLTSLKKRLLDVFAKYNGIMTELNEDKNYHLIMAFPNEIKAEVESVLTSELITYFVYYRKIDYFHSKLNLEKVNPILSQAFTRTLARFDQDLDVELIKKQLQSFDYLNIESFFSFKLAEMKKRWHDLVKLTNENSLWTLSQDSFEELLGFLIANLEPRVEHLIIEINHNKTTLLNESGKMLVTKKIKSSCAELWLFMILIKYSPRTISLKINAPNVSTKWLDKFFFNKIRKL